MAVKVWIAIFLVLTPCNLVVVTNIQPAFSSHNLSADEQKIEVFFYG
jgi:hypothetical protein